VVSWSMQLSHAFTVQSSNARTRRLGWPQEEKGAGCMLLHLKHSDDDGTSNDDQEDDTVSVG
jgi:hypothetical protein